MVADEADLTGTEPTITVKQETEGGLFMEPVYGDFFRTAHDKPQVWKVFLMREQHLFLANVRRKLFQLWREFCSGSTIFLSDFVPASNFRKTFPDAKRGRFVPVS